MTKHLVNIKEMVRLAKERGWTASNDGTSGYVELYAPDFEGPKAVWHEGSLYGRSSALLHDRGQIGYGYNDWFNGPWHFGHVKATDHGLKQLLEHPSMAGVRIA